MEEYQLLGEGTFGCVYKPSLPCADKEISYKNKISKLMLSKAAMDEIREYATINAIDKKAEFYTGKPIRCTVKESPEVEKAMQKCGIVKKMKNKTMKQITQETAMLIIGDGGADLEKWVRKVVKSNNATVRINDFWLEMVRMFKGVQVLRTHGLLHHDLKPQNIVYREETKRSNFIDFGLMRSIKSEAAKCREVKMCKGSSHWNYPTEVVFMNKKEFDILTRQSREQRVIIFEKYMEAIKNKQDLSFVTAFNIMVEYIFKKEDTERRKIFISKYWSGWKDLLLNLKSDNYKEFLNKTLEGFDVFGLALTFIYVLTRVQTYMKLETVKKMDDLFIRMMTPNIFARLTIEQAMMEYEKIIADLS